MAESVDSLNMDPILMPNIYKVNDILHMLWIGTLASHLFTTTTLVGVAFGS